MADEDSTVIEGTEPEESTKPEAKAGNVQAVSSRTIAQIREEAAQRARRKAQHALERDAKNAGFTNYAEMMEAAKRARRGGGKPETRAEKPDAKAQADTAALQHEVSSLREANKRLLQRIARLAKETKRAIKGKRAIEAEMELRVAATRHGVRDVDYAVHLLQRKLANASQDEQVAFNEDAYFSKDLKKTHPHLYQAGAAPATTSPETKTPSAPKTEAVTEKQVSKVEAAKNARDVPREEYLAMLARLNLKDPATATY